jgi:hypothetical protein
VKQFCLSNILPLSNSRHVRHCSEELTEYGAGSLLVAQDGDPVLYQRVRRDEHLRNKHTAIRGGCYLSAHARANELTEPSGSIAAERSQIRTSIWPPEVGDFAPVAALGLAALATARDGRGLWASSGAGANLTSAREGRKQEAGARRRGADERRWRGAPAAAAVAVEGDGMARAGVRMRAKARAVKGADGGIRWGRDPFRRISRCRWRVTNCAIKT